MIIRFGKFEATMICSVIIAITFFTAVSAERKAVNASAQTEFVELPIIMYHHITETPEKTGKYTVHTSEFSSDLEYIESNGFTPVSVSELIEYVNGNTILPENPIMITFDDGFESFYSLAYPMLKEKNMKSVVSVIGKVTEIYSENEDHNINYSNLTFDQINELISSGIVEVENHSYDMHHSRQGKRKGISKLKDETDEEYKDNLTKDLLTLQKILKQKCGITPKCVVYPYGAYSSGTLQTIKKLGFKCSMVCEERINRIVRNDPDSLFNLGRYNRPSGISSEVFFEKLLTQ